MGGLKRVRTPHYINERNEQRRYIGGFGEGRVKAAAATSTDDATDNGVSRKNVRRRGDERLAAQEHPMVLTDRWRLSFEDSKDSGDEMMYNPPSNPDVNNPWWQMSALALLFSVVFLSALFMHVISDAQKANTHHHHHRTARTRSGAAVTKKTGKKKTDEWSSDNNDELGGDSMRSHSHSADVDEHHVGVTSSTTPSKPVYYPFHVPPGHQTGLQHHRHRKSSQTNAAQQGQQTAFQQRNYYLNQSGGAVVASFKNNSPQQALAPRPSIVGTSPHGGTTEYQSGTPLYNRQQLDFATATSADATSNAPSSYYPPTAPPLPQQQQKQPPRGSSLYPQLLSSASSFDSIVEQAALSYRAQHQQQYARNGSSDELTRSPLATPGNTNRNVVSRATSLSAALSPKRSPIASISLRHTNHLLLSPGTDDVRASPQLSRGSRRSDHVEQTPRAGNLRPAYTTTLSSSSMMAAIPAPTLDKYDSISLTSETFKFATPPAHRSIPEDASGDDKSPDVPFIPNLDVRVLAAEHTPRPLSVNLDDLHLYQMLESGNVSHWEARVAEESRRLQTQAFPSGLNNVNAHQGGEEGDGVTTPAAPDQYEFESVSTTSEMTNISIPSNDPRKSIHHKRRDLTISTDASSSLQGAIEFSELQLVEVIGGGGFGQVWSARWLGCPVAVKVLTGSAQSKNVPKAVLEEFVAEINLLKGMRHPNICLYMGACLDPPNRAIITELAANGSLWDALRLPLAAPFVPCDGVTREGWPLAMYLPDSRHGAPPTGGPPNLTPTSAPPPSSMSSRLPPPLPPRGAWHWHLVKRVACGAARGMAYLHSGKPPVLHRDLKSANILLDDSYTAKVCDFGLSRLKAQGRSMTGNCGTVQWMAPEVLANMSYNEKADVYSFGIICWELLTRQCPFEGMTAIQCALAVLNRNARPEIPKWCPPSLHALIRACVKKDPDERPTFVQVLAALDAVP